jgi:hypothetical protein
VRARHTIVRGVPDDVQGCVRHKAIAKHQAHRAPSIQICDLNIAGIAWGNFKIGINVNGCFAVFNLIVTVDVVNVCSGIHVAVVMLKGRWVTHCTRQISGFELIAHHVFARRAVASEAWGELMSVVYFAAMSIVAAGVAAMHVLADVIMADVVTGMVSAQVTARVQGFVKNGGGNMAQLSAVVASVLDGTLEVLAGEIRRAVNLGTVYVLADVIMADVVTGMVSALGIVAARVYGFMNDGSGNTMNVLNGGAHNGSSAVVAAVLHGTLEVLAGDIARAVKTRNKRHSGWDSESNPLCSVHLLFLNAVSPEPLSRCCSHPGRSNQRRRLRLFGGHALPETTVTTVERHAVGAMQQ